MFWKNAKISVATFFVEQVGALIGKTGQ